MVTSLIAVAGVGFTLLVINAVFLGIIYFAQRKVSAVAGWPAVTGAVLMSTIESRSDGEGGYTDYPAVVYSYQVEGQTYQGRRIAPGPVIGGSGASGVVARYPAGAQVPVYYNPQNPADAALERKAPAMTWLWIMLAVFDCALCGSLPFVYWGFSWSR